MGDVLLVLGLAVLAAAGFVASLLAGLIVTGLALVLLSLAFADVKIRLPRVRVRPWRS